VRILTGSSEIPGFHPGKEFWGVKVFYRIVHQDYVNPNRAICRRDEPSDSSTPFTKYSRFVYPALRTVFKNQILRIAG
jgi:hypothetical protein